MLQYSKLQIGCFLIILYMTFIYIRGNQTSKYYHRDKLYEWLLTVGLVGVIFDGLTAYTVNHLEEVPAAVNEFLHMCFLVSLDAFVFLTFLYTLSITKGFPESRKIRTWIACPFVINILVVILFMPQLEYRPGRITNYSMGISAYTCFVMVGVYMLGAGGVFLHSWHSMDRHKQIIVSTNLVALIGVTAYQMTHPEALLTSLVPVFVIVTAYLNMENPLFTKLQRYNHEMVMGFATLVENRDDSTGGHIRRTTAYVRMLAEELKKRGIYKDQLTRDYIENLVMAAPMHDIGKIAIPDSILQKPGRLTAEEFGVMKTHAARGGVIIRETFGHLENKEYEDMAYEVAAHHHEKWNGKGYPDGLSGTTIPLCARIMAVADVFDAVSAKRCYRDALPLEECFSIIESGKGTDFDPMIAEVFLDMRKKVEQVYESILS